MNDGSTELRRVVARSLPWFSLILPACSSGVSSFPQGAPEQPGQPGGGDSGCPEASGAQRVHQQRGQVAPGEFSSYHCAAPQVPRDSKGCAGSPASLLKAPQPHGESLRNQPSSSLLINRWELPGCPPPAAKEEREIRE